MATPKMIFQQCSNCGQNVGPHNVERITINEMGLWFHHTDCKGSGFLSLNEVKKRAAAKADGNPFKQLEIEWYQERLKEVKPI